MSTSHHIISGFAIFLTLLIFFISSADYGFQPIDPNQVAVESDWRTRVAGEPDT